MPKLKPDTQRARREHILDAAQSCFSRTGFHATTMQDICKEATISPGALYVYFASKEDLIAGLCERDRAEFSERFAKLAAAPDFFEALDVMAQHYFVEDAAEKHLVAIEMGVESTRNPRVAEIFRSVDTFCAESFEALFQRLKDDGRINPTIDIPTLAKVFHVIGDGMFWRRAVMPGFDMQAILPVLTDVIAGLMRPVEAPSTGVQSRRTEARK